MIIKLINTGSYQVNTYLVYDEINKKAFIVDPGGYSKLISEIIKEENLELNYIILTHGHGDHIGGVEKFIQEFPSTKLVASKEEADLLLDPNKNMSKAVTGENISLKPDIFVVDGDKIECGELELVILSTPGHTKGGIVIYVEDVLFSGDTIFANSIGRTDFPGGSFDEIANSIKNKIYTLPEETKILPGHMEESTVGNEKKYNPFVY